MALIKLNDGLKSYLEYIFEKDFGDVSMSRGIYHLTLAYHYARKRGFQVKVQRHNI